MVWRALHGGRTTEIVTEESGIDSSVSNVGLVSVRGKCDSYGGDLSDLPNMQHGGRLTVG